MANEYKLSFTGTEVDNKLKQIDTLSKSIPTKTSQLTNDSGYLTATHNTDTSAHSDIREVVSQLSDKKNVLYSEQTLTKEEKAQARKNIGAASVDGDTLYTNLADPLPNNTTDTTKWVNGYRFSSSGISAQNSGVPSTLTNKIACKKGDVIRVKGVTFRDNNDRYQVLRIVNGNDGFNVEYYNKATTLGSITMISYDGVKDGVYTFTIGDGSNFTVHGIRFAIPTLENPSDVIITVNEEIVEGGGVGGGYDAVSVDCDFSNAKGELVGYFAGHVHNDIVHDSYGFNIVTTRCDAKEEHDDTLKNERVAGTTTEQSFDVFTVNKAERKIYATKIGAGTDREISY